ncbi:MAG: hypothetical protein ABIW48_06265, partial [Burkholderiales bacterium]
VDTRVPLSPEQRRPAPVVRPVPVQQPAPVIREIRRDQPTPVVREQSTNQQRNFPPEELPAYIQRSEPRQATTGAGRADAAPMVRKSSAGSNGAR